MVGLLVDRLDRRWEATVALQRFADALDNSESDAVVMSLMLVPFGLYAVGGEVTFAAHDILSGATFAWGEQPYVHLDPQVQVAHLIHVRTS